MAIDQRLRAFGQNLDVCLELTGRTHEKLAADTKIPVATLKKLHTGQVRLDIPDLVRIAEELNLLPREMTRTIPTERRRQHFADALAEVGYIISGESLHEATDTLLAPNREERMPPMIRRAPEVLVVGAGSPPPRLSSSGEAGVVVVTPPVKEVSLPDVSETSLAVLTKHTPVKAPSPKPPAKERKRRVPKAPPTPVGEEIDPAYVMHFGGVDYNLRDKALRQSISNRIRYARGSLTANTVVAQLSRKRTYAWLSTLNGLTPDEVVELATICSTTPRALITGDGIVELYAGEQASSWLERYIAASADGEQLKAAALAIREDLNTWSPALRNMLVKYLEELL